MLTKRLTLSNQIFFDLLFIRIVLGGAATLSKLRSLLSSGKETMQTCSGVCCRHMRFSTLGLVTVSLRSVDLSFMDLTVDLTYIALTVNL